MAGGELSRGTCVLGNEYLVEEAIVAQPFSICIDTPLHLSRFWIVLYMQGNNFAQVAGTNFCEWEEFSWKENA